MPPLHPVKRTLKNLDLRLNALVKIAPIYFSGFTQLVRIDLSLNKLNSVPNLTPVAQTLYNLRLNNNRIASLSPSLTNATFSRLRRLDITSNSFEYLCLEVFNYLPRLAVMFIDYNFLQTLEDMSTMTPKTAIKAGASIHIHLIHPNDSAIGVLSICSNPIHILSSGELNDKFFVFMVL